MTLIFSLEVIDQRLSIRSRKWLSITTLVILSLIHLAFLIYFTLERSKPDPQIIGA